MSERPEQPTPGWAGCAVPLIIFGGLVVAYVAGSIIMAVRDMGAG